MSETDQDVRTDETDSAQLDIATSFFAIVLLYLVIMIILSSQVGQGDHDTAYTLEDDKLADVAFRRFRALNPIRTFWYVERGQLFRINVAEIGSLVATAASAPLELSYPDGTGLRVEWGAGRAPTGFTMELVRPESAEITPQPPLWTLNQTFTFAATEIFSSADIIFVGPGEVVPAIETLERVTGGNPSPDIKIVPIIEKKLIIQIHRRIETFEVEGGFR